MTTVEKGFMWMGFSAILVGDRNFPSATFFVVAIIYFLISIIEGWVARERKRRGIDP